MSSEDLINTIISTTTNIPIPDYSFYDDEDYSIGAPCNNTAAMNFGTVFLPILYSLVFILGFIGNGVVVCVFAKHRNQINVTDVCLLNLAISDLFFALSMPFYVHVAATSGAWIFGAFMCHFVTGLHLMGFYGSAFAVIAMTLDRYVMIVHPHTLARHRSFRSGVVVTVAVWALSASVSLPLTAVVELRGEFCGLPEKGFAWRDFHMWTNNVIGLAIPLLVMIVCYSRILPSLMAMKSAKKHRVVRLVVIIIVVFFLFWTPYNIVLFLLFLRGKIEYFSDCEVIKHLSLSIQATEAIAFTHCCLNPIIYAFAGQKFARRTLRLLRAWVPCAFRCVARERAASSKKSSVASMSSEVTSTFIM